MSCSSIKIGSSYSPGTAAGAGIQCADPTRERDEVSVGGDERAGSSSPAVAVEVHSQSVGAVDPADSLAAARIPLDRAD